MTKRQEFYQMQRMPRMQRLHNTEIECLEWLQHLNAFKNICYLPEGVTKVLLITCRIFIYLTLVLLHLLI